MLCFRNWRYEQELASLIWKIDPKDIQMQPDAAFSALSIISNNAVSGGSRNGQLADHTQLLRECSSTAVLGGSAIVD